MTGLAAPHLLRLPRSRDLGALLRDGVVTAFFVALAFSISATQILLVLLLVLTVPWAVPWDQLTGRLRVPRSGATAPGLGAAPITTLVRDNPLTPPLAAFVALTLLSAVFSGDPAWSLWIARDTLRIGAFYLVLLHTRDSTHALRLWQGFLAALTLMATYGLLQAYACTARPAWMPAPWLGEICTHSERVRGPFSIYMTFGGVLLLGALFFLAYLANVAWRRAWWMVPAGALTVAALAFTYSRNAWLGLGVGVLGLVLTTRRALRVVLVLAAITAVTALVAPSAVGQRARSILDLQDKTLLDRVAMWRAGAAMIADHPVLGVGPGEVRAWYQHYRRPEAIRPSTGHLHNSPIQLAAERGLPALAVWIWLWVAFFRAGRRILARAGSGPSRARALVCASLTGVTGFLVAGLFEHNFGDGEVVMVVYALMALPFIVERDLIGGRPPAG